MTAIAWSSRAMVLTTILAVIIASPLPAQKRPSEKLGWLAGCWERTTPARVVEEQWTLPKAGMLFGTGRTIEKDSTASYELMRIFERGTSLIFEARPNGAAPVEFVARDTSTRVLDFHNTSNDFPQRVVYQYVSADSLEAFIEGSIGGRSRRINFAYRRTRCEMQAQKR